MVKLQRTAGEEGPKPAATAGGDITRVLDALGRGDDAAREQLLRMVYDEIHRVAHAQMRGEEPDRTLQATALIHEAYLRLMGGGSTKWENRAHFFASAAEVMRRVLIDAARQRGAGKRGGDYRRVPLLEHSASTAVDPALLIAVDEALERLAAEDPQRAAIVKLRFYSGLSAPETAAALGLALRTVEREWRFAKAWLTTQLWDNNSGGPPAANPLDS